MSSRDRARRIGCGLDYIDRHAEVPVDIEFAVPPNNGFRNAEQFRPWLSGRLTPPR
ncbi:MAG: hypothetical protein H5U40_16300 [Polyangiaceae bacterium]|nr:hypothetical protein [Polyangiaceae bacterium]